jgi:hypothetical protein
MLAILGAHANVVRAARRQEDRQPPEGPLGDPLRCPVAGLCRRGGSGRRVFLNSAGSATAGMAPDEESTPSDEMPIVPARESR